MKLSLPLWPPDQLWQPVSQWVIPSVMKKLLVYLGILRTLSWNLRRKMQWIGQSCSSQSCEPEEIRGSATCFAYNLLGGHSRLWSKVYSWQSLDSAPPQVQSQVWLSTWEYDSHRQPALSSWVSCFPFPSAASPLLPWAMPYDSHFHS